MVKTSPRRVGWWGKLPARGDFVGRGLPPRWRAEWDAWLQAGFAMAAQAAGEAELRERVSGFSPWRYLAMPAAGETWCGLLVASQDRCGRAFPLTLAERMGAGQEAAPVEVASRLASLLQAAGEGPEALEAAIAAFPHGTHAQAVTAPAAAWPRPPASLWWPMAAQGDGHPRVSSWPPEPALLLQVLAIHARPQQTASAE